MIGPRLVPNLAIYWYNKINLNSIDLDLINEKYDYQIKHRINENIRNGTFNIYNLSLTKPCSRREARTMSLLNNKLWCAAKRPVMLQNSPR